MLSPKRKITPPPQTIRQAKLDNLALVPASLLPFKAKYQALANTLSPGEVLIVLPQVQTRSRKALAALANRFQTQGHRVVVVSTKQLH